MAFPVLVSFGLCGSSCWHRGGLCAGGASFSSSSEPRLKTEDLPWREFSQRAKLFLEINCFKSLTCTATAWRWLAFTHSYVDVVAAIKLNRARHCVPGAKERVHSGTDDWSRYNLAHYASSAAGPANLAEATVPASVEACAFARSRLPLANVTHI